MVTNIPATPDLSRSVNFEPVAWAVAGDYGEYAVKLCFDEASAVLESDRRCRVGLRPDYVVVPLYRHPQPTLTDEERAAMVVAANLAISAAHNYRAETSPIYAGHFQNIAATLRNLLKKLVVGAQ